MAERIEGEVRFETSQAVVELNKIVESTRRLEQSAVKAFAQLEASAQSGFKAFEQTNVDSRLETLSGKLLNLGKIGAQAFEGIVRPGIGFGDELANANTIVRLSSDNLELFSERLRTSSDRLGFAVNPTKAAAGAYDVLSAGFTKASDAAIVLDESLRLAKAGRATSLEASDLLTTQLNSFKLGSESAALASDKLTKTVEIGKVTIPQLAQSLGLVASSAYSAGVSMDEMLGSIASASAGGIKASSASEGLRSALNNLTDPSAEAQRTFEKLGIRVDGTTLKTEGLLKTLEKIARASKGNTIDLANIFPDSSGRNFVNSLIDEKGINQRTTSAVQGVKNAQGTTSEFIKEQTKSAGESLRLLEEKVEALKISTSNAFAPILITAAGAAKTLVDQVDKLNPTVKLAGLLLIGLGSASAVALGGFIGLRLAIPLLQAQLALLGGELAVVGTGVLTFGQYLATTSVTVLFADYVAAGTTALTAFGVAVKGAGSSLLAMRASGALTALAVAGLTAVAATGVVALLALSAAYLNQLDENDKLAAAYESAGRNLKEFSKTASAVSLGTLLNDDAKKLADAGVNLESFALKAIEIRDKIESIRNTINGKKGKDTTEDELELKQQQKLLDSLLKQRDDFAKEKASREPAKLSPNFAPTDKQVEKDRENRLKDSILEIQTSERTAKEKIKAYQSVLAVLVKEPEERRQILRLIAAEEAKFAREQLKAKKDLRDQAFKDAKEEIDSSTKTNLEKIDQLRKLSDRFKLNANEERTIRKEIAALNKKEEDEQIRRQERILELQKEAKQLSVSLSDQKLTDLKDQQSRGVDTTAEQIAEQVKKKQEADLAAKAELERELLKEKDPAADKILKQNAKVRSEAENAEYIRTFKETLRESSELGLRNSEEQVQLQKTQSDRKISIYKEEFAAGKDVFEQLKKALLESLQLKEQEIKLDLEQARLSTDSPEKIKRLEIEAEGKLLDARRATKKEIEETTKALIKQKEATEKKAPLGGLQTLDEVLGELRKSNIDDVTAKIAQNKAFYAATAQSSGTIPGLDGQLKDAKGFNLPIGKGLSPGFPDSVKQATESAKTRQDEQNKQTVEVSLKADLRLLDSSGKPIRYNMTNQQVTIDGRNSQAQILAARMNPAYGGV